MGKERRKRKKGGGRVEREERGGDGVCRCIN